VAQADDTTDVGSVILASFENEDYSTWPYSRRLLLNTTSSGAYVPGMVTDFPVLVRLHRGNFDFSQSRGTDIRFSNAQGAHLRYEIEQWDPAKGEAAIWVRVDTIRGNSNQNYLTLLWGRNQVPDWSNGQLVFDTAAAFGGVWHLKESAADTLANRLYADATPAENHGNDRILGSDTAGLIGNGQYFSPTDYIQVHPIQTLKPSGRLTVSGWFKASATGTEGGDLLSMGDSYGLRVYPQGAGVFLPKPGVNQWQALDWRDANLLDTAWHYLVGVYTGKDMLLYVDGRFQASLPFTGSLSYLMAPDFFIGRHGTGKSAYKYSGYLDEIRVSATARSADWIRLCFENQRVNGTLVEFK
jgi:biopolymer transport protein ExbB